VNTLSKNNKVVVQFNRNDVRKAWNALQKGDFLDESCLVAQVAQRTFNEPVSCDYGVVQKREDRKVKLATFYGKSETYKPANIFDSLKREVKSADRLYECLVQALPNKVITFVLA